MNSFYGGRRGPALNLVKCYDSIQAMINDFSNHNDCNVPYDACVFINNRLNDYENGRLYRRGYNLNNGLGGAEFLGYISGPAGAGLYPNIFLKGDETDISEIVKIITKDCGDYATEGAVVAYGPRENNKHYFGYLRDAGERGKYKWIYLGTFNYYLKSTKVKNNKLIDKNSVDKRIPCNGVQLFIYTEGQEL